jgi:hypothetical protein
VASTEAGCEALGFYHERRDVALSFALNNAPLHGGGKRRAVRNELVLAGCTARRPNLTTPMSTAPPSQRPPQDAGGGVDRKTIYNHDWNAERCLSEEVRHLRLGR